MAITDINISEQLQTDAPSIKYTGNEGPQASPQYQQEQMIARQIWEALGPEQQGRFQSFEQFFQSGIWKQILQQMQQDEGQGQQGIGSLGPDPMQQQAPMPNRMGAQYGGRMGYSGGGNYEAQVQQLMDEGISRPMAEFLVSQGISTDLKAQGGRIGARLGGDMEELSMRETIDTPQGIETLDETETMKMAGGGARGWKAQEIAMDWAYDRYGKEFYDLSQALQMELYSEALDYVDSGGEQ